MGVEVVHAAEPATAGQGRLGDATHLGARPAHDDLRIRVGEHLGEPWRWTDWNHLLVGAVDRNHHGVMEEHQHGGDEDRHPLDRHAGAPHLDPVAGTDLRGLPVDVP